MSFVLPLAAVGPDDAPRVGNKAAGLGELCRAGFTVPGGFCVTVDAYRARGANGAVPPAVIDAVLAAYRDMGAPQVAVRSSSPSEDRADASFAGQYRTILGVFGETALIDAIRDCWDSASASFVDDYRRARSAGEAGDDPIEMAVVVQALVPATAAGVLFTVHPVTNEVGQVVVNANFGLGESVVSGETEPDTFVLDKTNGAVVEQRLGSKKLVTRIVGGGVEAQAYAGGDAPCLSPSQLIELAATARRLEAWFDGPIDAEWAFADDRLHLLQARPITTAAAAYLTDQLDDWARDRRLSAAPDTIWRRGSPLSGLPVSPLYYSEMAAFFSDMFPAVDAMRGTSGPRRKLFRYHNGYTYSNTDFVSIADPSPDATAGFLSPQWRANLRIALKHPRSHAFWCNIDYYYAKRRRDWLPGIAARRPDPAIASAADIRAFIEYVEAQRRERSIVAALAVRYAGDFLELLNHLLRRWAPDAPADTVGVLTGGLPESLTHHENSDLWAFGEQAKRLPAVAAALLAGDYEALAAADGAAAFLVDVEAYRGLHAYRGCSDRDLLQKRWGDDRNLLLDQIAMILKIGDQAAPEAVHERAEARRLAREREVFAMVGRGLFGPLRRAVLRRVLRATQRYWIHRDNQRHTFDHYFYELRGAYRLLGQRLADQGALATADDVFFAGKGELYAFLDGRLAPERLRARASWRRDWWPSASAAEPPGFLRHGQPFEPEQQAKGDADIAGTGGAPGVVEGPVRLVRSLKELGEVAAGDIIVTHAIDPAWTPVFGMIGGVISEEGGMLSHATVLGREYGLPVVIGAPGAMARLDDGVVVRIDGTAGTVHIKADTPEPAPADA